MDEIVAALAEQNGELGGLVEGLDADGWARATPCEGWDVADVLLHLCQTNEMAVASARDRMGDWLAEQAAGLEPGAGADVDAGAAALVAAQRGAPHDELLRRWHDAARAQQEALADGDPHRRVDWVAGRVSLRTLASTRLAETWIHTGDVAAALGAELERSDRVQPIARLAWRTLPYAFGQAGRELSGPVAFELTAPSGTPWSFQADEPAVTTIRGDGFELCRVAGRRLDASSTGLTGEGPDVAAVLELVRTYA